MFSDLHNGCSESYTMPGFLKEQTDAKKNKIDKKCGDEVLNTSHHG